jgi:hypothetical protein
VKTRQAGTGRHVWWEGAGLIDGDVPGGHRKDFGVSLMEGGLIGFGVGMPDVTINSKKPVNDDKWHHIVVTRNS